MTHLIEEGCEMHCCWLEASRVPLAEIWNWPPVHWGRGETEGKADPSRWVGGGFNKQGNLRKRLVLGGRKMNRSPNPPSRILRVYREALTGLRHINSPDGLNTTSVSQGQNLENPLLVCERWAERTFPRAGEGVRSMWLPRYSSRVNQRSRPLNDLLQQLGT